MFWVYLVSRFFILFYFIFCLFPILGIKARALCILGKQSCMRLTVPSVAVFGDKEGLWEGIRLGMKHQCVRSHDGTSAVTETSSHTVWTK